jgi:hypothetical protein
MIQEVDALVQERADFLKRPVELPEAALSSPKAMEAIERAIETGKPFGLMSFPSAAAHARRCAAIRVSGLAPSGREDWVQVRRFASPPRRWCRSASVGTALLPLSGFRRWAVA